jgi:hypothetical protein
MSNNYSLESKSSFLSLLFTGRILHILNPWRIEVNALDKQITVKKRNWYLISVDENTFNFGVVRNIVINKHLFGADITIKAYGGSAVCFSIPKRKAIAIRDLLLKYKSNPKNEFYFES